MFRRVVSSIAAAALLVTAVPAAPAVAQLPRIPAVPTSSDPLDTPQARKVINDAWKAIPKNVRNQIKLPPGSSQYIDRPAAKKPKAKAPVNFQPVIDRAVARFGGTAAIAFSDGKTFRVWGDDAPHYSYSTVKVPISVAALRHNRANMGKVRAAITYSDNAAATTMRSSVPAGSVDRVVNEAGSRTAAPVTGWWGNTPWSTSQQAKFVANLPCVAGAKPVVDLMGQVVPEQRWGVGRIPGAKIKGGWAPRDGRWMFRQMARIPTKHGVVAVALTARPGSGGYGDAQAMINMLADGISQQLSAIPAATCQG